MARRFTATIDASQPGHRVSPLLFGLFLEDINFACDGGLNANLVRNFSFDGIYLNRRHYSEARAFLWRKPPRAVADRLRYWTARGATLQSATGDGPVPGAFYARLQASAGARLENAGHTAPAAPAGSCAMQVTAGAAYEFSALLRAPLGAMTLSVQLQDGHGAAMSNVAQITADGTWQLGAARLSGSATGLGRLVITCPQAGIVDLDTVELRQCGYWGEGDPRWRQGRLRRDLVEVLQELAPRFLRFPGGCIVEGSSPGNEYDWRDTVGELAARRAKYNLWGAHLPDGGYSQSFQIGFYEYFLLCEDLGMEPLPTLFAGLNCQFRSRERVHQDDADFTARVIAPYLDLIDYATADPADSPWARLRAEAGHPAPFRLNYIGIGNENHGAAYLHHADLIRAAIAARDPRITCVMSAGAFSSGRAFDQVWAHARGAPAGLIVDEHCYARPAWFYRAAARFDAYDRAGPRVYMGEYAANFPFGLWPLALPDNCWETALAEAAFLTGIERNSDIVAMASYAPLLARQGCAQWRHNLIAFNGAHVLRSANFFVQSLFAQNLEEFSVPVQGRLPAGVFASATCGGGGLVVKLVNATRGRLQALLEFPGCTDSAAELIVLQSDDLRARNGFGLQDQPLCPITPKRSTARVAGGQCSLDLDAGGLYVLRVPDTLRQADALRVAGAGPDPAQPAA